MRYKDDFFRVGASGSAPIRNYQAQITEPTETAIIETVTSEPTSQVTNEIATITANDSTSRSPETTIKEVTNETATVKPTVINQYPTIYPGYGFPTAFVIEDPYSKGETTAVVSSVIEPKEDNLKKMIMWLVLIAVVFLVYKQITKK